MRHFNALVVFGKRENLVTEEVVGIASAHGCVAPTDGAVVGFEQVEGFLFAEQVGNVSDEALGGDAGEGSVGALVVGDVVPCIAVCRAHELS